eukprot:7331285-Prymnesium_polylepis.1
MTPWHQRCHIGEGTRQGAVRVAFETFMGSAHCPSSLRILGGRIMQSPPFTATPSILPWRLRSSSVRGVV